MRKPQPLTPAQRDCLGIIAEYWSGLGRSPTFQELKREMDYASKSGVSRMVDILAGKGWLLPRRRRAAYSLELAVAEVALPPEGIVEMTTTGEAFLALAQYENGRV